MGEPPAPVRFVDESAEENSHLFLRKWVHRRTALRVRRRQEQTQRLHFLNGGQLGREHALSPGAGLVCAGLFCKCGRPAPVPWT